MKHEDCQRYSNRDQLTQVTFFDVGDLVEVTISLVFSSVLELDSQAARSMPSSYPKIGTG